VGTTPTDPVEFRKCARDLKALSAVKEYTNEEEAVVAILASVLTLIIFKAPNYMLSRTLTERVV